MQDNEVNSSHFIFADDLMILCKGDVKSVNRVMDTLDHFSKVTGLISNMDKSSIFLAGVDGNTKDQLLARTRFTVGTFPIMYLGLPLSPKKKNKLDCHMLVEKITRRITITYSKHLSYLGRLQVINAILFSIHSF